MSIFGFLSGKTTIGDQIVIKAVRPTTTPISKIPSLKPKTLSYMQQFAGGGRGNFLGGEYDLTEIGKIEDTDSFVRQSFKKKEGLMFKEGVGYKGANKDTVRYVKTRMSQIARATNIPQIELLKRTARSLIRTSNAFIIKVRKHAASGGKVRETPAGRMLQPVAGYFPAAPETMRVDIDPVTGRIRKWQQMMPDGKHKEYRVDDVIHFHIDRREGFLLGVPVLTPVKDDIRALRQIEENIELLLYQNLFPLFHYKVGTETAPAGLTEEGDREIDIVEQQVRVMPAEGAIVTPERHDITAIGSEGRALRAEGYLEHFKKRVFAGLGVSSVDMGDGDTTNRATANTLSRALVDAVKDIQDALEAQWDHEVITELLLESTFGEMVLEEDSMVHINFNEIDIQNKMELEKHRLEMFTGNAITWDELRADINLEPIPVPEDAEDQDPQKYPEWFSTNWKLFIEPENLIRAVDEPYSVAAKQAAEARSMGTTSNQIQKSAEEKGAEVAKAAEEDRKTKLALAATKPAPDSKQPMRDNFVSSSFKDLESDTALRMNNNMLQRNVIDKESLMSLGVTWAADIADKLHSETMREMIRGFNDQTNMRSSEAEILLSLGRNETKERIDFFLQKLVQNTVNLIERRVNNELGDVRLNESTADALQEMHLAFDAVRYRTDFIWDVETRKAYNYGRVLGMRFADQYGFAYEAADDTSCERCKAVDGIVVLAAAATMDDVPPLHPHSRMKMKLILQSPDIVDQLGDLG